MGRKKREELVASVAAFDPRGRLLFGLRTDSHRWTLPGGHLEEGESPEKAAVRELREEAGLSPTALSYLGSGVIRRESGKHVRVYCFRADVDGEPHGGLDPDEECATWRFVDVGGHDGKFEPSGLPPDIADHLHSRNNVTLRLLGLQDGEVRHHWGAAPQFPDEQYERPIRKAFDEAEAQRQMDAGDWPPRGHWLRDYDKPFGNDQDAQLRGPNAWTSGAPEGLTRDERARQLALWEASLKPGEPDLDRLLRHPDPRQHLLALKMPGVERRHLVQVLEDPYGTNDEQAAPVAAQLVDDALRHPALDSAGLHEVLDRPTWAVPQQVVHQALQTSPLIDHTHLQVLLDRGWGTVHPGSPGIRNGLYGHPKLTAQQALAALDDPGTASRHIGTLIAKLKGADQDTVHQLAQKALEGDAKVQEAARIVLRSAAALGPETVQAVLANRRPWAIKLQTALAGNPVAPPDALRQLADFRRTDSPLDPDEVRTREAAIQNAAFPAEHLGLALQDPDPTVRTALVSQAGRLQPEHLEALAGDESSFVRAALANHPATPPATLGRIAATDPSRSIQNYALQNKGVPSEVFANHLKMAATASDHGTMNVLANSLAFKPEHAAQVFAMGNDQPPGVDRFGDKMPDPYAGLKSTVIANQSDVIRPEHLDGLLASPHPDTRRMVLRDSLHPEGRQVAKLAQDRGETPSNRRNALGHPAMPPEAKRSIALDQSEDPALRAVAISTGAGGLPSSSQTPLTQQDIQHLLTQDPALQPTATGRGPYALADALAKHPSATSAQVQHVLSLDGRVAEDMFEHDHPAIKPEHVQWALTPGNLQYGPARAAAVGHRHATPEQVRQLIDSGETYGPVVASAINSGHLSEQHLRAIQDSTHHDPNQRAQARQVLAKESPDSVFTERVGVRLGTGKLRKVRDQIVASGKPSLPPKELPPGDWSAGRGKDGNIHADKLQEAIDRQEPMQFNLSHSSWNGAQRHSDEPSKVLQLNLTSDHVRKMKEQGVYGTFRRMQEASVHSNHPVSAEHGIGWVRYTQSSDPAEIGDPENCSNCGGTGSLQDEDTDDAEECPTCEGSGHDLNASEAKVRLGVGPPAKLKNRKPDSFFIDEIQSDLGQSFVRQAAQQAKQEGQDPEEAAKRAQEQYPDEHFKVISKILFGGKHPNEVLHEAFQQHLRDVGHHEATVQVHSVESKAPISLGTPLPKKCATCGKLEDEHAEVISDHKYRPKPWLGEPPFPGAPAPCGFQGCWKPESLHGEAPDHDYEPGEADRTKAPGHFNVTYHDVPKKMGMEPSTYGKLRTQRGHANEVEDGAPTWEGKVRKSEVPLAKATSSLGWLPAFRHQVTGEIRSCPEGYHDLDVLPGPSDQGWDSGFVDRSGAYYSREEAQRHLGLNGTNSGALHASQVKKAEPADVASGVRAALTDELRRQRYRGNPNPLAGHCYVAAESAYHLLGGPKSPWVPQNVRHEGDSHWYLRHRETGEILDPTAEQFSTPVPYQTGRGKGFLTLKPSARAQQVISSVRAAKARKSERSFQADLVVWAACLPLSKMAVDPKQLGPVARYHDPSGHQLVDDSQEHTAHPQEHDHLAQLFKSKVLDSPETVKRGKTGSREASNSTGKVVYDVQDDHGADHRFMLKPYHEKVMPRARKWMQHAHQGWAEVTNQALYHAGGIGDLHQAVHVAGVPMVGPEGDTTSEPMLAVHMRPGVTGTRWAMSREFSREAREGAKKIGLMDFLTNNLDRHGDNLLFDGANRKFLAVDHSRSFQYRSPDKRGLPKWQRAPEGHPSYRSSGGVFEDQLGSYLRGSALADVDPPVRYSADPDQEKHHRDEAYRRIEEWKPVFEWWAGHSSAVRRAMVDRLQRIQDPAVREHIQRNFDARADQLDAYARDGHENYGFDSWDQARVPLYRFGTKDHEEALEKAQYEFPHDDPYQVLGLPPGTDPISVKSKVRELALQHHPDRGGDPMKMRRILEAYARIRGVPGAPPTPPSSPAQTEQELRTARRQARADAEDREWVPRRQRRPRGT